MAMPDDTHSTPKALNASSILAINEQVNRAKERGWLQPDLRRWFSAQGVKFETYRAALAGGAVDADAFGTLVQVSIVGLPDLPHAPNPEQIREHIEWLIAPARGAYDDALVEIAWGEPEGGPASARLFGLDEVQSAVDFAMLTNLSRRNVYIGAALRLPDAPRDRRASAEDFYVATAVPIDIDQNYEATRRAMQAVCDDGLVVNTGLTPERRSQHWVRLSEPCDSDLEFAHGFRGLVEHVGADLAVKDAARVMRLGGTVAFPNERKIARGYRTELTTVSSDPQARPTDLARLRDLAASPAQDGRRDFSDRPQADGIERGGLLGSGKVLNGRERFFATKLLPRCIREHQAAHAGDPTADELWAAAFAIFCEEADNSDERWTSANGQHQLRGRARNALRRLRLGHMARIGLSSIETGIGRAEAQRAQEARDAAHPSEAAEEAAKTEADEQQASAIRATAYQWLDPSKVPPRDVLYGGHLFRRFLSCTVAPGGLGKSSLALVEALAMVTGRPLIGEEPKGQLRVWYWNGEDPQEELRRRVAAACKHYEIGAGDLGGRLFIDSGRDTEIIVVREDRQGVHIAEPVVSAIIAEIQRHQIDVLIIDPFVASHAVSENDNTKIEAVVSQWMRVAEAAGCAVELIHHVRKPSSVGAQETTVDDARGAGALLAKVRSARVLNAMGASEADELGIERGQRFQYFRVDVGKANLTPRGGDANWRRMISVPVGSHIDQTTDEVGVATAWDKPGLLSGLPFDCVARLQGALAGGQWRKDPQAQDWVGHVVGELFGIETTQGKDSPGFKRTAKLVELWISKKVLAVVQARDSARVMRPFVVLGSGAE